MKWTTSWASVASNASFGNGSASAEASATVTPEGSREPPRQRRPRDRPPRPHRLRGEPRALGQDARAASDVQRSLAGRDAGEVRERRRQAARVLADEGLVGISADRECHRWSLPMRTLTDLGRSLLALQLEAAVLREPSSPAARAASTETRTSPDSAADASRAVVFTTSPRTVISTWFPSPTVPNQTRPVWTPAPTGTHGPSGSPCPVRRSNAVAASTARRA